MSGIEIAPLVVPSSAEAADAADFRTMIDLGNRMARIDASTDDLDDTVEALLPPWLDQSDRIRRGFVARRDGVMVGAGDLETSPEPSAESAELSLSALPTEMAAGTGDALLARLEQEARALGRRVVQTWSLHPAAPGPAPLTPPTGAGAIAPTPLSDALLARGYVLEQVERTSSLPLGGSTADLHERLAAALAHAGDDYRVVEWTLPTPPHLRAGYGGMIARMATDVPSGDMLAESEEWNEGKVARRDARLLAGGSTFSVAAVIHEPTGDMVAFNELMQPEDPHAVSQQWGTLVVQEHRGRRLGTIVKCANLLRWRGIAPLAPRVTTFNAEENRPMLDINDAIGFTAICHAAGWQKVLV